MVDHYAMLLILLPINVDVDYSDDDHMVMMMNVVDDDDDDDDDDYDNILFFRS